MVRLYISTVAHNINPPTVLLGLHSSPLTKEADMNYLFDFFGPSSPLCRLTSDANPYERAFVWDPTSSAFQRKGRDSFDSQNVSTCRTHPFTREPGQRLGTSLERAWWKKLPEWNASRKLNCRERAEKRRRRWGSFGVRQSNKRSAEISASPLTRSDRACTGNSHLHGHMGNGPLEKRCFTGPFFLRPCSCRPVTEGGWNVHLPVTMKCTCTSASSCSRMGGRDCSPQQQTSDSHFVRAKSKNEKPLDCSISWGRSCGSEGCELLRNTLWQRQTLGAEFGSGRCTTSFLIWIQCSLMIQVPALPCWAVLFPLRFSHLLLMLLAFLLLILLFPLTCGQWHILDL